MHFFVFPHCSLFQTLPRKLSRIGQAALYGIYFDDTEYNYMQHLKPIGTEAGAVFIEAPARKEKTKVFRDSELFLVGRNYSKEEEMEIN